MKNQYREAFIAEEVYPALKRAGVAESQMIRLIDMFFLQYLKDIEEQFSQKEALSRFHLITEKIKRDLTEK